MTHTEALLDDVRAAHPLLEVQTVTKGETVYADDANVASELIGIVVDGFLILDFFASDCGRFVVEPEEAYGVQTALAQSIKDHNGIC